MVKGEGNYAFQRLHVWQDAMELVRCVYKVTEQFPDEERYGITAQLRRAVVSIPVNIAEGRGRFSKKEQVQFFYNARGSLYEVITLLTIAFQQGYYNAQDSSKIDGMCQTVLGQLSGLINSLKRISPPPLTPHPSPSS